MKALRKMKPGTGLELEEVPVPAIKPTEVLIRVIKRAICGSDLHIWTWDDFFAKRMKPPVTVGHEFCGEIEEVGSEIAHYRVGELVTAEMHLVCNQCYACRTGDAHLCANTVILGVDGDGAFADYIAVPESNLWRVPEGVDPEFASIYDPFGNAVHTVMAGETVGKSFLVLGGGPIGLASIPVAKAAGASVVIVSEVSPYRKGLATKMGADHVIDPSEQNLPEAVRELTGGAGADVVLEMSGAVPAVLQGFQCVRPAGRYSLLGVLPEPVTIDLTAAVVMAGITINGIHGRRMYETWFQMDALLTSGRVDLAPMITHRFPMEDFEAAFAIGLEGNAGKIILE